MNKIYFAIVALILWVGWPAQAQARMKIVCLGDSITNGAHLERDETYPARLAQMLPDAEVINAGVGGNTSTQGLARLEKDVLAHKPDCVVILFGTNDSVMDHPGEFKVPPVQYGKNLSELIQRSRERGATVLLCTLLPINSDPYFNRHPKSCYDDAGGLEQIVLCYREAAQRVGRALNVPVVDLYEAFSKDMSLIRPAPDGVHPNARGAQTIALLIAAQISSAAR